MPVAAVWFRLEHEFGIEIPPGELWPESAFRIRPEWVQDGILTDNGLAALQEILPYADFRSPVGECLDAPTHQPIEHLASLRGTNGTPAMGRQRGA